METWWKVIDIFLLEVGLSLNRSKTSLIGINLNSGDLAPYSNSMWCSVGSLPFNYLGFSIGGSRNRKEMWNTLEEQFRYIIDRLRNVSLSKGGRLTLVQSVLNSLPCYLFSFAQAPTGVINRLEKMIRNFVWIGGSTNLVAHLVKWDCTSRSICYGGLEIGSFRQKNIALLTKWFWRFSMEEASLWRRLIVAIWLRGEWVVY